MGIQCIESVTYTVDGLEECTRFFTDFGLTPGPSDPTTAEFSTLAGQVLRLETEDNDLFPPRVEDVPTIREVVWGVDTPEELDRLVRAVGVDRDVRLDDDGIHRFVDEAGFGVGLTVTRTVAPEIKAVKGANRWGDVGRWNDPVEPVDGVNPIRICHVALNITKADSEKAVAFYTDRLGFRATDILPEMGTFMQCEGDDDQHNFLLSHRPDKRGVNHISFEVPSLDDVVEGGNNMILKGWREARRLGRHTIGSNVFRFIHAPCGGRVELAYDMDRVDESYGPRIHDPRPPHHVWMMRTNVDVAESAGEQ